MAVLIFVGDVGIDYKSRYLAHGLWAKTADGYSSLDRISLDLYVAFWLKRGARVGYRENDEIHWNDGAVETIDPAIQR